MLTSRLRLTVLPATLAVVSGLLLTSCRPELYGAGGGYLWTIDTATAGRSNVGYLGQGNSIETMSFEPFKIICTN